jgi:hypothetical protein
MRQLEMLAKMAESPRTNEGTGSMAFPVLAGGAGGIGAYALMRNILKPTLMAQEETLRRATAALTKTKMVPLVAGALGALIIGTLAAQKARNDERRKIQWEMAARANAPYNRPGGSQGFSPHEQVGVNQGPQYAQMF